MFLHWAHIVVAFVFAIVAVSLLRPQQSNVHIIYIVNRENKRFFKVANWRRFQDFTVIHDSNAHCQHNSLFHDFQNSMLLMLKGHSTGLPI